jgi:N-acetylglucosamine-6-sulfatase
MKIRKIVFCVVILLTACVGIGQPSVTSTPVPYASLVPLPTVQVTVIPKTDRPNIILILTDDLDAKLDTLDYMPNLQKLMIERGLSMKDFFITTPTCCPSRTTFLRGQYTHNHEIYTSSAINGFQKFYLLHHDSSTIATWLDAAGYQTIFLGKYLNGYPIRLDRNYVPQGWDEWYSPGRGKPYTGFNYTLNVNGTLIPFEARPEEYLLDVLTLQMQNFLHDPQRVDAPFFMLFAPYQPHEPATPATRHADLFADIQAPRTESFNEEDVKDKPDNIKYQPLLDSDQLTDMDALYRDRLRSMQSVDEMIAGMFSVLEETGQLDNTYIIFTSDNGYHLGQHRLFAGKGTPYEEDINVPFIIFGPDIPVHAMLDGYLVGNVDIAPTIAELAGVIPPAMVDGRSLLPLFDANPPAPHDWRQAYLIEYYQDDGNEEAGSVKLISADDSEGVLEPADQDQRVQTSPALSYHGLRTDQYLYVEYADGFVELYDMDQDPYQLENIASMADPQLLADLSAWLKALYACKADSCRQIESDSLP